MKKSVLILFNTLLCSVTGWSQLRLDIMAGVSPATDPKCSNLIINRDRPVDEFQFSIVHVEPQISCGVKIQSALQGPFFMEGGLSYNRRTSTFQAEYTNVSELNPAKYIELDQTENMVLLPVNIGASIGPVDFTSGLTAGKSFTEKKDFMQIDGFREECNPVRMYWQAGVRYAFHRTMIGIEYRCSLARDCSGFSVHGTSMEIQNVPGHLFFTFQFRLPGNKF